MKSRYTVILLVLFFEQNFVYGNELQPRDLKAQLAQESAGENSASFSSITLPDEIKAFLLEGAQLPIYIKSRDSKQGANEQPDETIGDAELGILDNQIILKNIKFRNTNERKNNSALLNEETRLEVLSSVGKKFNSQGMINAGWNAQLQIDYLSMKLQLWVDGSNFQTTKSNDGKSELDKSSAPPSTLLQYNLNAFKSFGDNDSHNANLNFDSISSLGENHIAISGSAYSSHTDSNAINIDKALLERDFKGKKFAVGMLDSWAMQSLGNVSTLDNERMYGFSMGNNGSSVQYNASKSLTPIEVYFPATGEARIMRDGRVISVQQFGLGRHEIDTKNFSSGIYEVYVDVVIGGDVYSHKKYKVNKPTGKYSGDGLKWQFWGGVSSSSKESFSVDESNEHIDADIEERGGKNDTNKHTPLAGMSLSSHWLGIDWSSSLYLNDKTVVNENWAHWQPNSSLSFDLQNLYANDGTSSVTGTINSDLPEDVGSVWVTREFGHKDSDSQLSFDVRDYLSGGVTLNLSSFSPFGGALSTSYEKDNTEKTKSIRIDFDQNVYSGRFGIIDMRLGASRDINDLSEEHTDQYFASLNFTLPLDYDFSIGVSHQDDTNTLDLSLGKEFEDSLINYANFSMSRDINNSDGNQSINAYANYESKYGQGTISAASSDGNQSVSISDHGTLAWSAGSAGSIALGAGNGDAGIVIFVPDEIQSNELEAQINRQTYPLDSGDNLIPVSPYDNYTVDIRTSEDAKESYAVSSDENSYTLYPGNVVAVAPVVKKMVTVFGRLMTKDGDGIAFANIRNHIGITTSDAQGNFSIDVDKSNPQMMVDSDLTGIFEVKIDFTDSKSTQWMGNVIWQGPEITTYNFQVESESMG